MRSSSRIIPMLLAISLTLLIALAFKLTAKTKDTQVTLASYELIGTTNIPTGTQFEGTEIGGLSSITYDPNRGVYYAISDDQGTIDPVRYYTLDIDVSDGQLDPGDIAFLEVTTILDASGALYAPGSLDPEGLVLAHEGQLYFTSEGFALRTPPVDPFINRLNLNGYQTRSLVVPDKFLPNPEAPGTQGVRTNLGFESLNVTPDQQLLVTASEGALVQDGPAANLGQESFARILQYRLSSGQPGNEYVYIVNPVAAVPVPPTNFRVNGLVELLPLDNLGTMLAMERSFSVGAGNTIWLYEIETQGATNVAEYFSLFPNGLSEPPVPFLPVTKRLILNVEADLGIEPDNLEGMAFGPALPDGRLLLVLVSDNNFDPAATTQFIVLAVELDSIPSD
jgi:3-phytase/alkaline phosphatase D